MHALMHTGKTGIMHSTLDCFVMNTEIIIIFSCI